jgi:hypothetical protein
MTTRETRFWRVPDLELRAAGDGALPVISGYGCVFNKYSQNLGGFVEQIDPHAFDATLSRANDVKSYWNHECSLPLGRISAGNLSLEVDTTGVKYAVTPPNTTYARDLTVLVDSKIVAGSSFTFRVMPDGEVWSLTEQGFPLRTITALELYEMGPVTDPAYLDTEGEDASVALRSLAKTLARPFAEVAEAARANELRSLFDAPVSTEQTNEEADGSAQHARRDVLARRLALASRARH